MIIAIEGADPTMPPPRAELITSSDFLAVYRTNNVSTNFPV